jgi:peptidyl-tRNA hydrolase, PTH1 family
VTPRLFGRRREQEFAGWIVVGLGNPGPTYERTRHNVGYLVTDELAQRLKGRWRRNRSGVLVLEGRTRGESGVRLVLGRGRSYMNESGGPVAALLHFYRAATDHLVVVHDEIDLPYGDLRVKFGGGDNGHNGLKSIRRALGTGDYYRVRVGVGRGRGDPVDHVLGTFSASERSSLSELVDRAADAVESLVSVGLAATQTAFNS